MTRKNLSLPAAIVAGLLVGALLAAAPANALSCNNCVDATDILDNSIYNRHLTDNSVRSAEIANGQVYGTDIADGAVGVQDLSPNARAAIGVVQLSSLTGAPIDTTAALDSFTVTIPPAANGHLLIRVDGQLYLQQSLVSLGVLTDFGQIGLCTASASLSMADCGSSVHEVFSQDADGSSGYTETMAFSLARVVPVTPGLHTFYLNGRGGETSALKLYGGLPPNGATATVQFFPATLVVTS